MPMQSDAHISYAALMLLSILALIVLGAVAGLVWLLVNRKTRPVALALLGVMAVFTLLLGGALLWTSSPTVHPEPQVYHVPTASELVSGDAVEELVEIDPIHGLRSEPPPAEEARQMLRLELEQERLRALERLRARERDRARASRMNVIILSPIVLLVSLALLAGLVYLLVNPRTRAALLGLMGAAAMFALVLGAGLVVYGRRRAEVVAQPATPAFRVEAEDTLSTPPDVTQAAPAASQMAERPDSETPAGEAPAEAPRGKSLLRTVGMAVGKALSDAKKQAATVAAGAKPKPAAEADPTLETPPADRPDWVQAEPDRTAEGNYQMPISVGPFSTRVECDEALPAAMHAAVQQYVSTAIDPQAAGTIRLPLAYIRDHLVQGQYEEWREYEPPLGKMAKLHVLLVFDREANARLEEAWERVVVGRKLWGVGSAAAVLLLLLSTAWAYLKIDLATGGSYRGRLRLGAAAVILALVAAGALLLA